MYDAGVQGKASSAHGSAYGLRSQLPKGVSCSAVVTVRVERPSSGRFIDPAAQALRVHFA
jgi:hypothetical protein